MKQSKILRTDEVFPGSDIVHKYSFKTMLAGDSCALLARENHNLAMNFANSREQSAIFYREDCFECQSPHEIAV